MNNNQKEKGFSLVEVIIGMSLIAILFTILILEVNILDISRRQRYGDIAYHIANIQMESLRSTSFEELMESGTIVDDQLAQIPYGAGNYSVADYPGYEGVKKITVTVTWYDGDAKATSLQTLVTAMGIN